MPDQSYAEKIQGLYSTESTERDIPAYSFTDLAKDAWNRYTEHRRSQKNPFDMNEAELTEYLSGYVMGGMAKAGKLGRFFRGTKARVPKFGDTTEALTFGRIATKAQVSEAKLLRQQAVTRSRELLKSNPDKAMEKAVEGQFYREMLEEYYKKLGIKYKP